MEPHSKCKTWIPWLHSKSFNIIDSALKHHNHLKKTFSGTTPILADAVSLNCSKSKPSFSSNELQRHKPLSGLLADHDLESESGSVSVSDLISPISQSSYNPLLDDLIHQASDDSAYMVMSPATSSGIYLSKQLFQPSCLSVRKRISQ